MKIKNSIEEMFRKILLKIDHFHRVKKGILYIQNEASTCYHGNGQKKILCTNGSTYIAQLPSFI